MRRRNHIFPLIIWTLLWGLFFATLLLGIDRLPNSDFSGQFHAFGIFQAEEIAEGRLPIWSPGSYGGIPFVADTQAAVFYPLRWLTILFSLPSGFSYYVLELEGLLHIWLAGVFAYFLAFDITRDHVGSRGEKTNKQRLLKILPEQWAGLIAAGAFGLGGYLTSYPLLQLAVLESVAWLPLILYLLRRGVRLAWEQNLVTEGGTVGRPATAMKGTTVGKPTTAYPLNQSQDYRVGIPALLAAGIALGVSALAGHPQTFLHVAYLSAAYYFFLTWQARWRWHWVLGLGAVIGAAAVGIAAAAFIPAARFVPLTVRGDVSYDFVAKGFPLLQYIQLLIPGPLSVWLPQYTGLVTLFLAILAWFGRRVWPEKRQQAETIFWIFIVLLFAWLSLGDKGVLYELAYRVAPGFSLFRQQERLISLVVFGIAMLAAQGVVVWIRADLAQRQLWLRRTGVAAAAGLLIVGFVLFMSQSAVGQQDWLSLWFRQWVILAFIIIVLWPRGEAKWDGWRCAALLMLLGLDLFLPVRQAMDVQREPPTVFWSEPDWLSQMMDGEVGRFDGQNLFHANLGEVYGLEDIKGISPLKAQVVADFEDLPRPLRWRLQNVRYVMAESALEENLTKIAEIPESILPGEDGGAYVYRFEDALPRAWMVYEASSAGDDGEAYKLIREPDFNPEEKVILTNPTLSLAEMTAPDQEPEVEIERISSSELTFTVDTGTDGVLVISEWALPGWQASLDGQKAPLLTADYGLQAVEVPAGQHFVTLNYTSRDALLGIGVMLLTLLVSALLAWLWHPVVSTRSEKTKKEGPRLAEVDISKTGSGLKLAHWRWIMGGIVLLGFGLRLFFLGHQELRGDEAFSYQFTMIPLADVVLELIDQGDPHSPLHYLLLNAWVDLAGDSEFAMRWLSLLPGLLLIPVLYRLGYEMAGRRVGVLAAFLTAVSPSLIWLSQDVRNQYTMAMLFTSLATWLLVVISKPDRDLRGATRIGYWVLYMLLAGTAVYSHYYALFGLLAHGLYLWFSPERRRSLLPWAVSGLATFLIFLPWLVTVLTELLEAGQLSDPSNPELAEYLVGIGRELFFGSTLMGWWVRWLILGLSGVVLVGFLYLRRMKPGWAAMLMGWLGGAAFMIFLVRFSRSTFNEFYISVAAPAWLLLLAVGLLVLWRQRGWRRGLALAALIALLASTIVSLRNYYFDPAFSRTIGYREMAAVIEEEAEPGDLFLAHFPDPAFVYYLRNIDIDRSLVPSSTGLSAQEIEGELRQLAEEKRRLWLVPYHRSVWDPEDIVPQWLAHNSLLEMEESGERMTAELYRSLYNAEEVMAPLEFSAGESIGLDGVYVLVNGRPVDVEETISVPAGSSIQAALLWSTDAEIPSSQTVFVHVIDENGLLIAQHDGIPVYGSRPTNTWLAGEKILDTHEVVLPDGVQGTGRIVVGLYDSETLERQPFESGLDVIELGSIQVEVP